MTLVKFNPEKKNNALLPGFNDIFESVLSDTFFPDRRVSNVPAVNISETSEEYHIELAAPGLKKEDFKVSVDREMLTIATEQSQTDNTQNKVYNRREFSYSAFTRTFALPESGDIEHIRAVYADGILKLSIPKKEESRAFSKQIEIQ
ncbi:Hsp20/alpha crystallin family protein [Pedobacter fastidiosus]|uniref:Hsp20/alpha crystallin family protein n=1 Tax=Pedobacter fastidiosus TaxID=2765361 RepID=A0ABR7KTG8_9SPHI|nr:Hsp20/alpha crystallin family protein [Pedobacter fastidiosus]MBC6111409.1 Hsp20/alpha crystallin family protein [Pedobacter fastidiosus]